MIVETEEDFRAFQDVFEESDSVVIPIFTDPNKHPLNDRVSLLFVKVLKISRSFILVFDHPDASSLPYELLSTLETTGFAYVPTKKDLVSVCLSLSMRDVNLMAYLATGKVAVQSETFETTAHAYIYRNAYMFDKLNRVIPLLKHMETCERMSKAIEHTIFEHASVVQLDYWTLYNEGIVQNLAYIESQGMHVDKESFVETFGEEQRRNVSEDSRVFTSYNMFTSTGRPSNKFGGVNYAALNKTNGNRSAFTSRFDDGILLQLDYDAFHFRLIASLIGYTIPTGTYFHEYLGKNYYFKTNELSADEYNESKRISFKFLYGNITDEIRNIVPFFDQTQVFIDKLWHLFRSDGYIKTPLYGKVIANGQIDAVNPNKLFNYLIQNYEMEIGSVVLEKLRKSSYTSKFKSVPILYTYDSFLFDYALKDGREFVDKTIKLVELDGMFPVKVEYGSNYHDLQKIECS